MSIRFLVCKQQGAPSVSLHTNILQYAPEPAAKHNLTAMYTMPPFSAPRDAPRDVLLLAGLPGMVL